MERQVRGTVEGGAHHLGPRLLLSVSWGVTGNDHELIVRVIPAAGDKLRILCHNPGQTGWWFGGCSEVVEVIDAQ